MALHRIVPRIAINVLLALGALLALSGSAAAATAGSLTQLSGPTACIRGGLAAEGCSAVRMQNEPSASAISPDGRFLYAVSANTASTGADDPGLVAVFARDPATGSLTQLSGAAGCVSEGGFDGRASTCTVGRGLHGAKAIAISADGASVYVGSSGALAIGTPSESRVNAIAIFTRDPASGALSQPPGTAGCVSDRSAPNTDSRCANVAGPLRDVSQLIVSPDGQNLYAAVPEDDYSGSGNIDQGAVVSFARTGGGGLTQLAGTAACVANNIPGCATGRALREPKSLAITADGSQIYVAASEATSGGSPNTYAGGVVLLNRNSGTGALSEPADSTGCITADGTDDSGVAGSCTKLSADGSLRSLNDATSITVSPDGRNVYVAAQGYNGDNPLEYGALTLFNRASGTGALSILPGTARCVSQDGSDGADGATTLCNKARAMYEPTGVTLSPDGQTLYLASGDSPASLDTFSRAADGTLAQRAGQEGCISEDGTDGANGFTCALGAGMRGANTVTLSPAGACQSAYLTAQDVSAIGTFIVAPTSCLAPGTPAGPGTNTPSPAPNTAPGTTKATSVPPVLSGLRVSPAVFRAASSGPTIAAKKKGTTISYRDSEKATTSFIVQRKTRGARRGGRCVKRTKRTKRSAKGCTRYVRVGSFTHADSAGVVKLHFSGRLKGRKLKAGSYRLSAQSRNAAGQRSATSRKKFRVKR